MHTFWTVRSEFVKATDELTTCDEFFQDLVICKKYQLSPHAIPCAFDGTAVVAKKKSRDLRAATIAEQPVICHFSQNLSEDQLAILNSVGARRLTQDEVEKCIVGGTISRHVLCFQEPLNGTQQDLALRIARDTMGDSVVAEKLDSTCRALVLDLSTACDLRKTAQAIGNVVKNLEASNLSVRSYQGSSWESYTSGSS